MKSGGKSVRTERKWPYVVQCSCSYYVMCTHAGILWDLLLRTLIRTFLIDKTLPRMPLSFSQPKLATRLLLELGQVEQSRVRGRPCSALRRQLLLPQASQPASQPQKLSYLESRAQQSSSRPWEGSAFARRHVIIRAGETPAQLGA